MKDTEYSWVPLWHGPIYHWMTYNTKMTVGERKSDFKFKTDTPYLARDNELWGVYCEDLGENWPCYNGTALFVTNNTASRFD